MLPRHEIPLSSARAAHLLPRVARFFLSAAPCRRLEPAVHASVSVARDHPHDHGPLPLARVSADADARPLGAGARADPRLHGRRGGGRDRRRLAGAALRRGAHAHRRRRDRAGAGRAAAGASARPSGSYTYGLRRAEILSAQVNGVTLLLLGALIVFEGIRRLIDPPEVEGSLVLIVALIGIPVNLLAAAADRERRPPQPQRRGRLPAHPHRPVRLHRDGGRGRRDPAHRLRARRRDRLAAGRGAMLWAAYGLLRDSGRIFMEAAPRGLDPQGSGTRSPASQGVVEVHDLHVWEVTSGMPAVSAHMIVGRDNDCHAGRAAGRPPARGPLRRRALDPPGRARADDRRAACRSRRRDRGRKSLRGRRVAISGQHEDPDDAPGR